ncbi:MAG: UDP-2,4-diacetamido-2,4,6-trideoxy-beta-L-altropyranose hydrolase, partial [Deltaproteobacteria bacterium]|nr:UDP-2,4-diacetamido-2,4,6-trideoxy-beta-L-altropyranose hydrolase [Deltaproteobacteria bacterium]
MSPAPLIIRADASPQIGTGHIMRCIALAQAWQDCSGKVTFLSHCENDKIKQRILNEGFEFLPIEKPHPDPSDLKQILTTLKQLGTRNSELETWLALDGYHFTPDYQKAVRDSGYRLLVIDDMAHLDHYCADILLNQNIYAPDLNYSCDKDTVKLLGCEYVLLRREFLKYKDWKREIPEKARKILVTLGGADPDNVTLRVIKALKLFNDPDLEVKVIVGPSNPHLKKLQSAIRNPQSAIHILQNVTDMPSLMAWADVAVSAAGSTCWELAFMGAPSITVVTFSNQQDVAKGLERAKIFKTVGWYKAMNNDILVAELSIL